MQDKTSQIAAIVDFLTKNNCQCLATIGLDGRPKVRPFQFQLEEGGRLFFCTSNSKPVFRQIKSNPYIELCVIGQDFCWLRLSGKVIFSSDFGLKAKILQNNPLVQSIYKSPENPAFEVFYLTEATATICDFSGKPPRTFTF